MRVAPESWSTLKLGDALTRITYGFTNPMPTTSDGPYMVTAKDIRNGRIDYATARKTSLDAYRDLLTDKSRPNVNDVLLTKDGSIGRVALCDRDDVCINQSVALLQTNSLVDSRFLAFLLQAPEYQQMMAADADGSTIKHIYISRVDRMTITLPPIAEQQAIAEVLEAIDDKVAANARLALTVDQLARLVFSLTVADTPMSDSTFEQVCEVGGGGTPKTGESSFWGGNVLWATPTDVTALSGPYLELTSRTITNDGLESCSSPLYPAGSILMTSRATIGAFAIAGVPMAVNQGFIVVNPRDNHLRYWFFHEMRDRVDEFISHANGATFLELSRGNFKRLPVRLAGESVMTNFCERAEALHASAAAALVESRLLRATRDELLPLLMSGRLRVKDAEAVAESAI